MEEKTLNKKLNEYFKISEYSSEQALNALSLLIYSFDADKNDLFILAKLFNSEDVAKLVYYYNGATLKIPTIEEYKRAKVVASCYYLREVKGWTWPDIKEYLNLTEEEELEDSSTKSIGKQIAKIKEELKPDFMDVLIDKYDFNKVIKNFVEKIPDEDVV